MATLLEKRQEFSPRFQAILRRAWRWLTTPQVFLSLIMLIIMFYMVIIPLYRMVMTTITFAESDLRYAPGVVPGELTLFHWLRMLSSQVSRIMTFEPLLHSVTVSLGATLLSFLIGGAL